MKDQPIGGAVPFNWDDPILHQAIGLQNDLNKLNHVFYKKRFLKFRIREDGTMNDTIGIYEIFAVYTENPEDPIVFRPQTPTSFGYDEDEAILRSGIYMVLAASRKEPTTEKLDPRWVTIICREIGRAKIPPQK
jgi:hypothetical protein